MKISVNIPSYKRPVVESLAYIPYANVWVCETEADEYIRKNKGANIKTVPLGVQGNVSRIRNYILDREFDDGCDAVCIIDDDMQGIYMYEAEGHFGYNRKIVEADMFREWLEVNANLCDELGFKLWGINLNFNPTSYRQCAPLSLNTIILGPFTVHLRNPLRYDEKLPLKEDYDLALQHLQKYNGILRLNAFHYVCKQSINVGGCANYRNYKREREQFKLLQKKWGSDIVYKDNNSKKEFDYNPIIKVPIKGV